MKREIINFLILLIIVLISLTLLDHFKANYLISFIAGGIIVMILREFKIL